MVKPHAITDGSAPSDIDPLVAGRVYMLSLLFFFLSLFLAAAARLASYSKLAAGNN
jgi:hypothetical protein